MTIALYLHISAIQCCRQQRFHSEEAQKRLSFNKSSTIFFYFTEAISGKKMHKGFNKLKLLTDTCIENDFCNLYIHLKVALQPLKSSESHLRAILFLHLFSLSSVVVQIVDKLFIFMNCALHVTTFHVTISLFSLFYNIFILYNGFHILHLFIFCDNIVSGNFLLNN